MTLDLDRIEKLVAEASPGPWIGVNFRCEGFLVARETPTAQADERFCIAYVGNEEPFLRVKLPAEANAAFIAAARSDVPALVAEVKRLREAPNKPVTDEEFSAAYLDMFSLAHDDEDTDNHPELSQNQRGAIICQILLRRRAASQQEEGK